MHKWTLLIVGVVVFLMGILGVIPGIELATEPAWHAVLKIIVGLIAIGVAMMKEKKKK